jgi:hypothetical protein
VFKVYAKMTIFVSNKYSTMIDLKKILEEEGPMRKYDGLAPEGFVLVCEKTLEDLKIFDIWKEWKNGCITLKELNNKNFPDE